MCIRDRDTVGAPTNHTAEVPGSDKSKMIFSAAAKCSLLVSSPGSELLVMSNMPLSPSPRSAELATVRAAVSESRELKLRVPPFNVNPADKVAVPPEMCIRDSSHALREAGVAQQGEVRFPSPVSQVLRREIGRAHV